VCVGWNKKFDEAGEIEGRMTSWELRYVDHLVRKHSKNPDSSYKAPLPLQRNPAKLTVETFDPTTYEIAPVQFEVFKNILRAHNLRWTTYKNETTCHMCRMGPVDAELIKLLNTQLAKLLADLPDQAVLSVAAARKTPEYQKIENKRQKLLAAITKYDKHVRALNTARKYAYDKRKNMKVGEVFVTRDFVNHHDHDGGHVKCLILVLEWYETEGGELQVLKIRHYCSDKDTLKTNFGYMLDIWSYQLHKKDERHPGFFDGFNVIYVGGDHGGHFSSSATMIEESKFYRLYGKEIRLVFFPAYHAHGRADAAGAEDKK